MIGRTRGYRPSFLRLSRFSSTIVQNRLGPNVGIETNGQTFQGDEWTNVTPKILSHIGKRLYLQEYHPLSSLREKIVHFLYKRFVGSRGNPIFSVYDSISPVVSTNQNFDSLLTPLDHPSRKKSDCYYINHKYLLRGHTTAHQSELIKMGLNNFLVIGDVYRRDEIDVSHYPVFHQADAVRLCSKNEVFRSVSDNSNLQLFEKGGERTSCKQEIYTLEATKLVEYELKSALEGLALSLFGNDTKLRWVEAYFPFTHPSWELEVLHENTWMELLGCGIMEHRILQKAGAEERIGWAFGVGLERLAMCLFHIPDIRLFWSTDSGILSQFYNMSLDTSIKYKPVSVYPQCSNDISFWLPTHGTYSPNDFYDLVRDVGGGIVEQIKLVDEFVHPKTGKCSHCYRIVYRHMEKTLMQDEVNVVHQQIELAATQLLHVTIR